MDPVSQISAALTVGARDGIEPSAPSEVRLAFDDLLAGLRDVLMPSMTGTRALERFLADPATEDVLLIEVLKHELSDDQAKTLVRLAQVVLEWDESQGIVSRPYNVNIHGAQGVQIGMGNTQVNSFNVGSITIDNSGLQK